MSPLALRWKERQAERRKTRRSRPPFFPSEFDFSRIIEYGEREMKKVGLAEIVYLGPGARPDADALHRYLTLSYAYGVAGARGAGFNLH